MSKPRTPPPTLGTFDVGGEPHRATIEIRDKKNLARAVERAGSADGVWHFAEAGIALRVVPDKPPIIWAGAILTEESRAELMTWWLAHASSSMPDSQRITSPFLAAVHMHHVTVAFKPSWTLLRSLPIGEDVEVKLVAFVESDKVQAGMASVFHNGIGLPCENDYPHLTISTAEGVPPKAANEVMVEAHGDNAFKTRMVALRDPPVLRARMGMQVKGQYVFDIDELPGGAL